MSPESEPESENDETFLDVPSDENTIPSYSDFNPDEFSIDDLQINVEKVDFEGDQIAEEESEKVESDSHMEFEGSNKIERRSAEESVEISECIDKKTAEESVETSENIEKRNVMLRLPWEKRNSWTLCLSSYVVIYRSYSYNFVL